MLGMDNFRDKEDDSEDYDMDFEEEFKGSLPSIFRDLTKFLEVGISFHRDGNGPLRPLKPKNESTPEKDDEKDDIKSEERKFRHTEIKKDNKLVVQINLRLPENWISLKGLPDLSGFTLTNTKISKESFRFKFKAPKGYKYKESVYKNGVLEVLFITPYY